MKKSRFGGAVTVQQTTLSRGHDVNDFSTEHRKAKTKDKDKSKKPGPFQKDKTKLENINQDTPFRPVSTHKGGGIILPAQARAPRVVQSATIAAHLRHAFRNSGDTQMFLGSGALQGLWIGIPMWASSAWDSDPIPGNLAMEWLAGVNGLPIGTTITLGGIWGGGKSTLAMEVLRWIDMYRGFGHYIEHESKLSPNLAPAILGDSIERILIERADSVEHWQEIATKHMHAAIEAMKRGVDVPYEVKQKNGKTIIKNKLTKIGRSLLLGIAVDTIFGKMSRENQNKVLAEGHGQRFHAIEALINTNFFKTLPNLMEQYPILMVLISQTKTGKDKATGLETKSKAGGQQVQFVESFDLDIKKIGKIRAADYEGMRLKIKNEKNSFGPDHRHIEVDIIKWEEPDTTRPGQPWSLRNIFDWNTAAVELLASDQIKGRYRDNLNKAGWHLQVNGKGGLTGTAYSKTLGMKPDDAVPLRELGDMIHRNAEVLTMIRRALRIQEINYLDGDVFQQREKIRQEWEKRAPNELGKLVAQHAKETLEKNEKKQSKKKKGDGDDE